MFLPKMNAILYQQITKQYLMQSVWCPCPPQVVSVEPNRVSFCSLIFSLKLFCCLLTNVTPPSSIGAPREQSNAHLCTITSTCISTNTSAFVLTCALVVELAEGRKNYIISTITGEDDGKVVLQLQRVLFPHSFASVALLLLLLAYVLRNTRWSERTVDRK